MTNARAADYSAGVSTDAEISHNDNIRLVQDDKIAATKYRLAPKLTLGMRTETNSLTLDSTADLNKYDKKEFDSNDLRASFSYSHQRERSSLGLNANYVRNSTLTSEQLSSGRFGNGDRAEQYSVTPTWTYAASETNLVQLSGTYAAQNYANKIYTGYTNISGEFDWLHSVTSRLKTVVALTYSKYQSDDITIEVPSTFIFLPNFVFIPRNAFGEQSYAPTTKTVGGDVGLDYQWSEQTFIKLRLGRSKKTTSYPVKDPHEICTNPAFLQLGYIGGACNIPDTSGPQSNAELIWQWSNERHQFSANGSKAILPTSNGYAVDSTQLGISWSYQLFELDRISANLMAVRNRAIDKNSTLQNTSSADRDYGTITLQYQRQLSSSWFIDASYQYSKQKYTQIDYQTNIPVDHRASSNTYALGLSYRPLQWHWAR